MRSLSAILGDEDAVISMGVLTKQFSEGVETVEQYF